MSFTKIDVDTIIPPRMRTQSAGRPAAETLGGGTTVRVSRGGRGRRPREGNDERVDDLNGQGNDQGMGANGGENVGNVIVNGNRKMEYVQDMSGCSVDQNVKYTAGSFVGKALTWWNSQIRTLSQEVAIRGMVAATEPKTIQKAVQISGALSDKAVRYGSIPKVEKIGNVGGPSKDKNG
ncbi:hypothetical protein Tco_1507523 [Tanacetum coccineum]